MSKLNMHVCHCGRLHFYKDEDEWNAIDNQKELVLICSKCGEVLHIGASEEPDCEEPYKVCYNMYSFIKEKEEITKESFNNLHKIIVDDGVPVLMETGYYADSYYNHKFYDYSSNFDMCKNYESLEELKNDINEFNKKRGIVVKGVLLKSLTEEQKESFGSYWFEQFE